MPQCDRLERFLSGPAGGRLARPPLDRVALRAVTRWYFPLSRAWAAASAADGSLARFCREMGLEDAGQAGLARAVRRVERHRRAHDTVTRRWEAAFFGSRTPPPDALVALEIERLQAAHSFMGQRAAFARLHLRRPLPPVKWQVPDPASVERRYGDLLRQRTPAFRPSDSFPVVEESAGVPARYGTVGWVRFVSPAPEIAGTAWARVYTPTGVANPPTLLLAHGIGVESDYWRYPYDPFDRLVAAGICLVRMEAPWHGRRRLAGWAGGEPVIARAPLGVLDFLQAYLKEIAVLTAWARERNGGPVALGGISLGALTAQLAAVAARDWSAELRPDALLLVGTTASMASVLYRGSLTGAIGMPAALAARGWTRQSLTRWRPFLEPRGDCAVPAERIVMALGTEDEVTPFHQALGLAGRWGVPDENLFLRRQGHFSLLLGLFGDDAPLRRLAAVLPTRSRVPAARKSVLRQATGD